MNPMRTTPRLWTTAEFRRLVDVGIFRDEPSNYLWGGRVIVPPPPKSPRVAAAENLRRILAGRYPEHAWAIQLGQPLGLKDGYEPRPALMVLRGPRLDFVARVPRPSDVELLVEFSAKAHDLALFTSMREYAESAIPLYWVADVASRTVFRYESPDPASGMYRGASTHGPGETVPLAAGPVAVDDIFKDIPA